jgi:outer membrane protein assembly factor BamB
VVDKAGQVICVSRESGAVYWIRDLNEGRGQSKRQKKKLAPSIRACGRPRSWLRTA